MLPRGATGLRQPVHVADLAAAALQACDATATAGNAYALPGGETLPYREMVARVLRALPSSPPLLEIPAPLFDGALRGMQRLGLGDGVGEAAVARLREDLVFDAAPAQRDFRYGARRFEPSAEMFE